MIPCSLHLQLLLPVLNLLLDNKSSETAASNMSSDSTWDGIHC